MNSRPTEDASICVDRESLYFQDGPNTFFGWYHTANSEVQRDCVAVICGPIGHEYSLSHHSIRHLADRLAQHGIPAVRFDYPGTGDSPGTDLDVDRWRCWQCGIKIAIQRARELSGRKRICLLGVRLGATLAAAVSSEFPVDFLVLWNPCVSGRRYLREIQVVAMTGDGFVPNVDGGLESAGFMLSAQTITTLRRVDLLRLNFRVSQRALVVGRDDLSPETVLSEHFTAMGISNDHLTVPGYTTMMTDPMFTVIPQVAFSTIIDWVAAYSERWLEIPSAHGTLSNDKIKFLFRDECDVTATIEEQFCRFGEDKYLFGILSRTNTATNYPAIIFFNAGGKHHVGPNRLYVTLARNLTTLGFACFRFDLEGIGDSVRRSPSMRENHPYPGTAISDARSAIDYLKEQFGYTRFIALGLCSGAHTAFHAGLTFDKDAIVELILINPLTFYWVEGMSLETPRHFHQVLQYKNSARDLDSWLKLIRGRVKFKSLVRVALAHFGVLAKSYYYAFCETIWPDSGSRLSQDLKKLLAMKRKVTFMLAEGDPGRDILMAGARRTLSNARKTNQIRLHMIANADHTFTQSTPRKELIGRLGAMLTRQYGGTNKSA